MRTQLSYSTPDRLRRSRMFIVSRYLPTTSRIGAPSYMARLFAVKVVSGTEAINMPFLNGTEKSSEISIVSGNLPREQRVFHACAATDVVNDEIVLRGFVPDIYHDAYVVGAGTEVPCHHVARQEVFTVVIRRERLPFAREEDLQVRYTAMIDVRIRAFQSPFRWINGKV